MCIPSHRQYTQSIGPRIGSENKLQGRYQCDSHHIYLSAFFPKSGSNHHYIAKFLDGSKMRSGWYCLHSIFFKRGTLKLLDGSNMYSWWWYLLSVFFKRGITQRVQWNIMHWKQIAWEQLVLGRCRSRTERLEFDDKPKQKLWQTLQRKPSRTSQTILDVSS